MRYVWAVVGLSFFLSPLGLADTNEKDSLTVGDFRHQFVNALPIVDESELAPFLERELQCQFGNVPLSGECPPLASNTQKITKLGAGLYLWSPDHYYHIDVSVGAASDFLDADGSICSWILHREDANVLLLEKVRRTPAPDPKTGPRNPSVTAPDREVLAYGRCEVSKT